MREILFRGKRVDNGKWVEGNLAAYDMICSNYPEDTYNATGDYHGETPYVGFTVVDPSTVGQYTGLCDKNGKKIFERDILSVYFSAGVCVNGLVEFKDGSFGISWKWGDGRQFAAFTSITHSVEFEIIGNNRDNPELLEVSHE